MTNKLLKLPSQRQLVDRLLHLIEFNNAFVFLSGKPGCGRDTLCRALYDELPEKVRVVSLVGSSAMKMAEVRQLLLSQVVARPLFNPQDALAESFFRMLEGSKPATLLLLIERADQLPTELLGELWTIICHNDTLTVPHQLTIVVSGSDVWCHTQRPLLKGRAMPALELEVPLLSSPEQRIFLYETAKVLKIPATLLPKQQVEEILKTADGRLSTIKQLLEDTMTDRRPKKRQAELPVKKIATAIALVTGGLLVLSYLLPALFDSDNNVVLQDTTQNTTLPIPVAEAPLSVGKPQADTDADSNPNDVVKDWQPEVKALPQLVESDTVTTTSTNYEGRRVVISDEVVQKLMVESKVSDALPSGVVDELTGKTSNEASPSSVLAAPPSPEIVLTPAATLNKKSRNHFSIQLMGASNTKTVGQFVVEHGLTDKVWIYQTQFRGSPWYVVLQGDYARLSQARSAIRKLSPALLKGQPWPKSFAQIQKELKQ